MTDLPADLRRFLFLVPWLAQHTGGVLVTEVCEQLEVSRADLLDLLDRVALVGTPDGSPDELVDLYLEGERLFVALPQKFTRAPRFSPEEMLALLMVLAPLRAAPVPGLAQEARGLTNRLLSLGSERANELASRVEENVFAEGERNEAPQHLQTLELAVRDQRVCEALYYTAGRDALTERRLQPVALVERQGAWYVIGHEGKTYKVERFKMLRLLDETFDIPPDLDLDTYRRGKLSVDVADVARPDPTSSSEAVELRVGDTLRTLTSSGTARLRSWVRQQGGQAVLLAPSAEREGFLNETRELLKRYEDTDE